MSADPVGWTRRTNPNRHALAAGRTVGAWAYSTRQGVDVDTIVNHSAESFADVIGDDLGAENVDRYMASTSQRRVSWHATADSDSVVWACRWEWTCSHAGSGWNRRSWGLEQAYQAHQMNTYPASWVAGLVHCSSAAFAAACTFYSIPVEYVPPGTPGIVSHGSPGGTAQHPGISSARFRTDPGPFYPWDDVIAAASVLVDRGVATIGFVDDDDGAVYDAQRMLNSNGYGLTVDGDFGPATHGAMRDWQKSHGHRVTGVHVVTTSTAPPPIVIPPSDAVHALTAKARDLLEQVDGLLTQIDQIV